MTTGELSATERRELGRAVDVDPESVSARADLAAVFLDLEAWQDALEQGETRSATDVTSLSSQSLKRVEQRRHRVYGASAFQYDRGRSDQWRPARPRRIRSPAQVGDDDEDGRRGDRPCRQRDAPARRCCRFPIAGAYRPLSSAPFRADRPAPPISGDRGGPSAPPSSGLLTA